MNGKRYAPHLKGRDAAHHLRGRPDYFVRVLRTSGCEALPDPGRV
jgi:hypothetical protein